MMITIGSDHLGYTLKKILREFIKGELSLKCLDVGTDSEEPVDYPDVAYALIEKIKDGTCRKGILICGTGIGMAIAANKVPGIYAAVCHDPYSAERAGKSNNTNVMTLGSLVIGPELAKKLVAIWLASDFQGGRSARKVGKIMAYEERFLEKIRKEAIWRNRGGPHVGEGNKGMSG